MRLLIVTDHRFYRGDEGNWDTYCFDRSFYDDYKCVFDKVYVAARVRSDPPPDTAHRADGDGVEFIPLPDRRGVHWLATCYINGLWKIREAVGRSDAVCVRLPAVSGRIAAGIAHQMGKPVMFELIGDPIAAMGAINWMGMVYGKIEARAISRIVKRSKVGWYVSRKHLQERFPPGDGVIHDSLSDIRLPIDQLRPARVFEKPPEPMRVVLVASLVPVKRHAVLLRAAAEAGKRGASLRLSFVGDGPLRKELEELVKELGLSHAVTFHGQVAQRAAVFNILDDADLFVMSSATEGMPRAMIEAMARGLPVIGSDTGGIAELITPEQRFPVDQHDALAGLLLRLQRDPARLNAFALHSEAVAREYTEPVLGERRRRLLAELHAAARGATR